MNRWVYCILVLALCGYPSGNQSGWVLNVSHINISVSI
ncbi:hypothetical protein NCT2013_42840 [Enterobacter sp. M4-VN]|nr:hypothetical protein NCT2013_42840 [Enterobacter sp. M4-VN]